MPTDGFGEYYWKNGSYFKGGFEGLIRSGTGVWSNSKDVYEGEY